MKLTQDEFIAQLEEIFGKNLTEFGYDDFSQILDFLRFEDLNEYFNDENFEQENVQMLDQLIQKVAGICDNISQFWRFK